MFAIVLYKVIRLPTGQHMMHAVVEGINIFYTTFENDNIFSIRKLLQRYQLSTIVLVVVKNQSVAIVRANMLIKKFVYS